MKRPWSIVDAHQAIATGKLKPSELLADCLRRIDRWESKVHAWALVDRERALAEASRLDALGSERLAQLPLAGIPLGIKDIFDVAGLPTRAGSSLSSAAPAAQDATCVARLRAAGAIILGKTVTPEFAFIDPPPTCNPWNLTHTPGGSSSGSAAAAALGMCLGSVGSQTGGSIIRPAAYCGVAGLKPTFGRIDRTGVIVSSPTLDHVGALAGSVTDLEILWRVMADPRSAPPGEPATGSGPAHSGHAAEHSGGGHHLFSWHHHAGHKHAPDDPGFPQRAPRVAIVREFLTEVSPEVLLVSEVTLGWLESHGAELIVAKMPADLSEIHAMHRVIMAVEIAGYHRQQHAAHRAQYGPCLSQLIDEGLAIDAGRYQAAKNHQLAFQSQLAAAFVGADAWVMPATTTTAPPRRDTTGDARLNSVWSYAAVPAITLPCGIATDNMPVGLQVVAPAGGDEGLLAIAAWCEKTIAFDGVPSLTAEAD